MSSPRAASIDAMAPPAMPPPTTTTSTTSFMISSCVSRGPSDRSGGLESGDVVPCAPGFEEHLLGVLAELWRDFAGSGGRGTEPHGRGNERAAVGAPNQV